MEDKKLIMWLSQAQHLAQFSKAEKLKVGCVVVKNGRIITTGINGMPCGASNVCEIVQADGTLVTKPEVSHAEANAICGAAKNGIALSGAMLFLTHSPCFECSKLIVNSGIRAVFYINEYRDARPLQFLRDNGVLTKQVNIDE